jgi:RHS repeat-associated protein
VLASITAPTWSATVATDAAGNITDDGSQTYTPDLRNHLGERTVNAATLVNTYTADGRLARTESAGQTLTQLLDPAGRRLALHRSTTGWRDYVYLGDRLLGYFDDGDTAAKLVFTDHIGMPMLVVDGGGVVKWDVRAEPYGQLRDQSDKAYDPGLRYPGQWQDWLEFEANCDGFGMCMLPTPIQESFSLFENGFRLYRPDLGRYVASDPLGLRGGINLYRYANANPNKYIDPSGLVCEIRVGSEGYALDGWETTRWNHKWIEYPSGYVHFYPDFKISWKNLNGPGRAIEGEGEYNGLRLEERMLETAWVNQRGCTNCEDTYKCLKDFTRGHAGQQYRFCTNNCHDFVEQAMAACNLQIKAFETSGIQCGFWGCVVDGEPMK